MMDISKIIYIHNTNSNLSSFPIHVVFPIIFSSFNVCFQLLPLFLFAIIFLVPIVIPPSLSLFLSLCVSNHFLYCFQIAFQKIYWIDFYFFWGFIAIFVVLLANSMVSMLLMLLNYILWVGFKKNKCIVHYDVHQLLSSFVQIQIYHPC